MKTLYPISHQSALQFWRSAHNKELLKTLTLSERKTISLPAEYTCPATDEFALDVHRLFDIDFPITVTFSSPKDFRRFKNVRNVICPATIPKDSFVKLSAQILISSPEYCFLSLVKNMTLEKAVELANNLCSIYLIDKFSKYGQSRIASVCSVNAIAKYLAPVKNFTGIQKARRAIKYAVNNSGSPIESKLAVILRIPRTSGGYGIPPMEMNRIITLRKPISTIVGRDSLTVDMCWPAQKVIIEYDSDETHLSSNQHAYDKSRVNALTQAGYTVITVTKKNLNSLKSFDVMVHLLIKSLGLRLNQNTLDKYFDKRKQVFLSLFYKS